MKWNALGIAAIICGGTVLFFTDGAEAATLVARLLPIFVFVVAMSVVVNIAAQIGTFGSITRALEAVAPGSDTARQRFLWAGLILLSIISTIFLSLDTTAILITPLAIAVARRNSLNLIAIAFAVVWIANIGSLLLPVSNLTNLLALHSPVFSSSLDYASRALLPATAAIVVAIIASWVVNLRKTDSALEAAPVSRQPLNPDALRTVALFILATLLPLLASPVPYWLSSSGAALVLLIATLVLRKNLISLKLVPWQSLLWVTVFSTVTTAMHTIGGASVVSSVLGDFEESPLGLMGLAAVGAGLSNLINNIPAFLALEPAVSSATGYLALLIGTNAGPIITPWASLATLLWHDQLVRAGVKLTWRIYVTYGCILIAFALIIPLAALSIQEF